MEGSSLKKDRRCCPEGSSALESAAGRRQATEVAVGGCSTSATALHVEIEQTTTRHGRLVLQRTVRRNGVAWLCLSMCACAVVRSGSRGRGSEGGRIGLRFIARGERAAIRRETRGGVGCLVDPREAQREADGAMASGTNG